MLANRRVRTCRGGGLHGSLRVNLGVVNALDRRAAGAQPGPKGLRDVALLRLLHDLGLRRSEAVRLDIEDVDLQRNWIFISGKTRSQRELVSLPEPTRAALSAWLKAR